MLKWNGWMSIDGSNDDRNGKGKRKNIYESEEENKSQQKHTETHKTMTKLIQ